MGGLLLWLSVAAAASGLTGYRASKADFKALEDGVAGALKLGDTVFPEGLERIDFVLYDARDLYVYSRSRDYPFKKVRRWGAYQVYKIPHKGRPTEADLARCAGLGMAKVTRVLRGKISEQSFECAPWAAFEKVQKKRGGIYQYKEGYLASIVHEYGHQYQEQQPGGLPAAVALNGVMTELPEGVDRDAALKEAFASYCELKGSKQLYTPHFFRLMKEANELKGPDDRYGHKAGLRAAVKVLDAETKTGDHK